MEEQWINDLRERFADREQPAPEGLWDSIEAAMAEQGLSSANAAEPKRRAKVVPLWWQKAVAAAACLLIIICVTGYFAVRSGSDATQQASLIGGESKTSVSEKEQTGNATELTTSGEDGSFFAQAVNRMAAFIQKKESDRRSDAAEEQAELAGKAKAETAETAIASVESLEKPNSTEQDLNRYTPTKDKQKANQYIAQQRRKLPKTASHSSRQGFAVSLYGMGLAGVRSGSDAGEPLFYAQDVQNSSAWSGDNILLSSAPLNSDSPKMTVDEVNIKHRQPVKAGLSAQFKLTDRLGLESGMYYTYLSSDFTRGDETNGSKTRQKLHYVGIPVRLTCGLWQNKSLNVYAGAGAAVEIGVGGSSRTDRVTESRVEQGSEESMREKRPQYSVNASAGLQYDFNDHVGVYVEPGVSYYIKNGSSVQNFYKDKPLNFSLSLGLRFTVK